MPNPRPLPQVRDDSPQNPAVPTADRVRDHLLLALGRPDNLVKVQVRRLWDDFYRANVFVSASDITTVARSYFLEATADGKIVTSTPPLSRMI